VRVCLKVCYEAAFVVSRDRRVDGWFLVDSIWPTLAIIATYYYIGKDDPSPHKDPLYLKIHSHETFYLWFFHEKNPIGPLIYTTNSFRT
jgi:hypothetical protein